MEPVVSTMPAAFTTLLSTVWNEVDTCVGTIVDSPILLIPVGFVFAGGVIGIAKTLMGTKRRRRG